MNKYLLPIYIVACFFIYPFVTGSATVSEDSISNSEEETSSIDLAKKQTKAQPQKSSKTKATEDEGSDLSGPGRKSADLEYSNDIEEMNEKTRREIEEKRKARQEREGKKKQNYTNRSGFLEKEKTEENDINYDEFSEDTSLDTNQDTNNKKEDTDKDSLITDDIPDYNVDDGGDDFSIPEEKGMDQSTDMDMKMEMDSGSSADNDKDDFTDFDRKYTDEFEKERSNSGVDFQDDSFYETPDPAATDPLDTNEYDSSFGTGF